MENVSNDLETLSRHATWIKFVIERSWKATKIFIVNRWIFFQFDSTFNFFFFFSQSHEKFIWIAKISNLHSQCLDLVLACVLMSWVKKKQSDYWWGADADCAWANKLIPRSRWCFWVSIQLQRLTWNRNIVFNIFNTFFIRKNNYLLRVKVEFRNEKAF